MINGNLQQKLKEVEAQFDKLNKKKSKEVDTSENI
jgi:hypothetical protein